MLVLLVRHGHAGTKRGWAGDDSLRPLDPVGLAEADALALIMAPFNVARIVSSPYLRCIQSVTPLAETCGVPIEEAQSLVPEAGMAAQLLALGISAVRPGAVVLCTHGEVIHNLQLHLGKDVPPAFGPEAPREKGSVWMLERAEGKFIRATYIAPPFDPDAPS